MTIISIRSQEVMRRVFAKISWTVILLLCVAPGLAPYVPQPHLSEKVRMLLAGELHRPIDIFDLCFHGIPFLLLLVKILITMIPPSSPTAK